LVDRRSEPDHTPERARPAREAVGVSKRFPAENGCTVKLTGCELLDPGADPDRCLGSARRRAVPLLKQAHADEGDPEEGVASFVKLLA